MAPEQFKKIRHGLGLTQMQMANWINPHVKNTGGRVVRRWEASNQIIPGYIATLMLIFQSGVKPMHEE